MPVKLQKLKGGKVRVSTPNGVKSKGSTPANAERQKHLLNAVEHSDWRPTGKPARDKLKHRVMKSY
jgi:hypothetical protein